MRNARTSCPGCRALGVLCAERRGRIKWYDRRRGYGFVVDASGEEAFLHASAVAPRTRKRLVTGAGVSFVVTYSARGPAAENVVLAQD